MNLRIFCSLLALLMLPALATSQEADGHPDVWKSAGTKKATATEIQALIAQLGPGKTPPVGIDCESFPWGQGSSADEAAAALVEIGDAAINGLLPLLHDAKIERCRFAIEILGRIGNRRVVPQMMPLLDTTKDASIREATVESLAMLRDERLESTFLRLLQDKNDAVQADAAIGLGWLKSTRAIAPLVSLLRQSPTPPTWAGTALGEIGTPAFPALLDILTDPATPLKLLSEAIPPASKVGDGRVVPILLQLLSHPDIGIREDAIRAIPRWNEARAIAPLKKILYTAEDYSQNTAAMALAEMGSKETLDILEKATADSNQEVAYSACIALPCITTRDAVPMLLRLLHTGGKDVQPDAARALGNLKDERALPALLNALASTEEHLREAAATALGHFDDKRATDALLLALDDPGYCVLLSAIQALGDRHDPRILPALQRFTKDTDYLIQRLLHAAIATQQKAMKK